MAYHLDAAVFGNPTTSLSQTQADQFRQLMGDVGRGQYKSYNPTGPLPVSLSYQWTGAQLAQFRSDWSTRSALNRGASWFTADLPLMLGFGAPSDAALFPYDVVSPLTYSVKVSNSGTNYGFILGVSGVNDVAARHVTGVQISQLRFGTSSFVLDFDGTRLPSPNNSSISAYFTDTGETVNLTWNGTNLYYNGTWASTAPVAESLWRNGVGTIQSVILTVTNQSFQRYLIHTTKSFTANANGYDNWSVDLPVEIDASEALVI